MKDNETLLELSDDQKSLICKLYNNTALTYNESDFISKFLKGNEIEVLEPLYQDSSFIDNLIKDNQIKTIESLYEELYSHSENRIKFLDSARRYSIDKNVRTIKTIIVLTFIISIVAFCISFLLWFHLL